MYILYAVCVVREHDMRSISYILFQDGDESYANLKGPLVLSSRMKYCSDFLQVLSRVPLVLASAYLSIKLYSYLKLTALSSTINTTRHCSSHLVDEGHCSSHSIAILYIICKYNIGRL